MRDHCIFMRDAECPLRWLGAIQQKTAQNLLMEILEIQLSKPVIIECSINCTLKVIQPAAVMRTSNLERLKQNPQTSDTLTI